MPVEASSKANFEELIAGAKTDLVVVDFHATWCGPCKMIAPYLAELESEEPITVIKVDVDDLDDVAAEYKITAMPTFIFMKNGTNVGEMKGASKDKLKEMVTKHK